MKVKFTKLAALLLAGVALFATGCTDYEVDIQKNAAAIADANAQIAALQATIATLETAANHQADVDKLNKAITDLESSLKSLIDKKADKAALDAAIERIKAIEDAKFQEQIDALKADIAKMATKAELEKAVADLTTLINAEISKLEARIAATEAAIKKINEETIPGINQQIEALKTKNGEQDETIRLLKEAVDGLGAIYATKAEVKAEVDKIMKALEGYATTEALETAINEALAAISDVKGAIRSLVFVPEVYVDGVEAILVSTLHYSPLELKDTNKVTEFAEPTDTVLNVTPTVVAKYHVVPSDADLSFLTVGDSVKFVLRADDPFIVSRAAASEDFTVDGIYQGYDEKEADVIKIEVKVTGMPATEELISVVALQLTNGTETYTSDYATIYSQAISEIRIADPTNEEDAHYRRATEIIGETDAEAYIDDYAAWTEQFDTLSCDHQMTYDEAFDLNDYVVAHFLGAQKVDEQLVKAAATNCDGANEKIFEGLGFTWEFELVEDYELGDSEMFKLEDGVLTAKDGNAINLTPIVRVYLKDGENNVQIAYVKVWVAPSAKKFNITWSETKESDVKDQFVFKCEGDTLYADSLVLDKKIWSKFPITKANFDAAYKFVGPVDKELADSLGTVTYGDTLKWEMTPEQLWAIASDPNHKSSDPIVVTWDVYFEANNGKRVVVTLTADVKPIAAYKVPIDRYIPNFWTFGWDPTADPAKVADADIEKDFALYNVFTPGVGVTDPEKCIFENNINAAFYTDKSGKINLDAIPELDLPAIGEPGLPVSDISYYFCREHMEQIKKVGDYTVKFEVPKGDTLNLYATVDGVRERIAYIDNEGADKTPNLVYLDKESEVAKKLLNTMPPIRYEDLNGDGVDEEYPMPGELYICISAKGILCGDDNGEGGFEVNLFWPENAQNPDNWVDHFKAKYRQPVYLSDSAADAFIDAVDFGEGGSFINIKELVNPKDWRARPFEPQKDENFVVKDGQVDGIDYFSNYWQYYGPITVEVAVDSIKCTLGPDPNKPIKLPVTIIVDAPVMKTDLLGQIEDPSKAYREKNGKPVMIEVDGKTREMTIEEKLDKTNDMIDDETEAGFITYKNNGTNVTKDYDLLIPVTLNYGWGTVSKIITVKVFRTTDSFKD